MDLSHGYVQAALGFKDLVRITEKEASTIPMQLLRADCLLAHSDPEGCLQLLDHIEAREDYQSAEWGAFLYGLRDMSQGRMETAYNCFVQAMDCTDPAQTVIAGRKASVLAFMMADAARNLEAATKLEPLVATHPFAGGILAFAQHNAGHPDAEKTARKAIAAGFKDAWTLHAVAHCLYAAGQTVECVAWLSECRELISDCGIFIRIHFEFHLALAHVELHDGQQLDALCEGPLWRQCTVEEKSDYWTHTGVLNTLWKAELRGISFNRQFVSEALDAVEGMDVEMSPVFSLCVLRWTSGATRQRWLAAIAKCEDRGPRTDVYRALALAIDLVYPEAEMSDVNSPKWTAAAGVISSVASDLAPLGGSAEQREVLEDFVGVTGSRGNQEDLAHINLAEWLEVNRRPGVVFYDWIQQGIGRTRSG